MITETQLGDVANRVNEPIEHLTASELLQYPCYVPAFFSIVEFHLSAIEKGHKAGGAELL